MSGKALTMIILVLVVLAAGCGDSGGDAGGDGSSTTGTSAPATTGGDGGDDDSLGTGTVVVDGTPYSFTVFSCVAVGGAPNFGGEGDANVALSTAGLIVQIPETGKSYSVLDFEATLDGDTVTATGTGRDLAGSDSVPVELTATCSRF